MSKSQLIQAWLGCVRDGIAYASTCNIYRGQITLGRTLETFVPHQSNNPADFLHGPGALVAVFSKNKTSFYLTIK